MMASHPTNASMANHDQPSTQPTCQNCQTSTTPLWRRDELGNVLCNACGLFLKLHGRARPISLKTDVIKSRNRVKTMRPDMQMKKKSLPAAATPMNHNGMHMQSHDATSTAMAAVARANQGKLNGHMGDNNSPVSRTATPSMYDPHLPVFQGMDPNQFQSPSLAQYPIPGGSPGRSGSPVNGEPETREQLIAANASLKTRVSELDLINELYRGRLTQLEADSQAQDNFRHVAETAAKEAAHERAMREEIQRQLEDSHRRENILKRRLDEIEQELKEANDKVDVLEQAESDRPTKKPRLAERMKDEEMRMAEFQDAEIQNSDMQNAQIQNFDMQNAEMQNADMQNAEMQNVEMQNVEDMQNGEIQNVELLNSEVQHAEVQSAEIQDAEIQGAEIQGAELQSAETETAETETAEHHIAEHQTTEHQTTEHQTTEHQTAEHQTAEHQSGDHQTAEHQQAAEHQTTDIQEAEIQNEELPNGDAQHGEIKSEGNPEPTVVTETANIAEDAPEAVQDETMAEAEMIAEPEVVQLEAESAPLSS